MKFDLSWWQACLVIMVVAWPVTLLVTIVLSVLGILFKGTARVVFLSLAAIPVVVGLGVAVWFVPQKLKEQEKSRTEQASYAKRHNTLTAPQTAAGLTLPAGTVITWRDEQQTAVDDFTLPQPAVVSGIKLVGSVKHEYDVYYQVTLAEDEMVNGWPCKGGAAELDQNWALQTCVLARETPVNSPVGHEPIRFPAGTQLQVIPPSYAGHSFHLPADKAVRLPGIHETAPGGSTVRLYKNGAEYGVESGGKTAFSVLGIPFDANADFVYVPELADDTDGPRVLPVAVEGAPARDLQCDGTRYSTDAFSRVRVNLRQNTIQFTQASDATHDAKPLAPMPVSHCKVLPEQQPS